MLRLLLLFALLVGLNLFLPRDLWVQDEARYAEVVREMLAGGSWLVPHLNGTPYADKPAPYFWIVAGIAALVGQGLAAFLLFTFLATLATLAGVYAVGRALGDRALGFWSGVLFLTALLPLFGAQIARMDMALAAATVWAWYALLRFGRDGGGRWRAGFWALCIAGVAVKGPIALLFTALPAFAVQFAGDGWRGLFALHPLRGVAALGGVVLAWVAAVLLHGDGDYLRTIWQEQLLGRAVDSWNRAEPPYFYVALLPLLVMPWLGPILSGFRALYRERGVPWLYVTAFGLLPLLAISLISEKLFIYVLPLFPAFSIAGGVAALRLSGTPRVSPWMSWPPVLFLAAPAAALWASRDALALPSAPSLSLVYGALAALAGVGATLSRASGRNWLLGWVGIMVLFSLLLFGVLVHAINPRLSARPLGEAIARHAGTQRPVAVVGTTRGILNFYADRLVTQLGVGGVRKWAAGHPEGVLVIPAEELARAFGAGGAPEACAVHEIYDLDGKQYHVLAGC